MGRTNAPASVWAAQLAQAGGGGGSQTALTFQTVYGSSSQVLDERLALLRAVVNTYLERFGDGPLRVFRSPGRINLRGMHVDTHGGFLNLMTHQREVVIAVSPRPDSRVTFVNIDRRYQEVDFDVREEPPAPAFQGSWHNFVTDPKIQERARARKGEWGNYLRGCALRVLHQFPRTAFTGLQGVVGSDLPPGAALSSSAALCVATVGAMVACMGERLDIASHVLAARDAEWYTGSRCGLSDQAAMLLGNLDKVVHVALKTTDDGQLETVPEPSVLVFPEDLRTLVVHSYTQRSLSGPELVHYTRNRFAYSLAMELLRQEMQLQAFRDSFAGKRVHLADLSPDKFSHCGGVRALYGLLRKIPERVSVRELRERYKLPSVEAAFEQYFASVPEKDRPKYIELRGPLLFGIAESERARIFCEAIAAGDFVLAGRLMTIGHDGDRRVRADGSLFSYDVSDVALEHLEKAGAPIHWCPGSYGASSLVLDALVDAALSAGALGASLTGAGIAGSILALCRVEDADRVAENVRRRLAKNDYLALAGRDAPLTERELEEAVVVNQATAAAGELPL